MNDAGDLSHLDYGFLMPFKFKVVRSARDRPDDLGLFIPLWLPFGIAVIPTAILWSRDRRSVKTGHCPDCGYNLTGNESGICPECAAAVPNGVIVK